MKQRDQGYLPSQFQLLALGLFLQPPWTLLLWFAQRAFYLAINPLQRGPGTFPCRPGAGGRGELQGRTQ